MSDRRLVDTNLIVRHLIQDHAAHAAVAAKLFQACDHGELTLVVLPAVIAECVFVLESFYKRPRIDIARSLAVVFRSPGVELDDLATHLDALERFSRTKLHYVDCTIAAAAAETGLPVATFDSGLEKVPGIVVYLS